MDSIRVHETWGVSPQNADAECDVLGCVMVDPTCRDIVAAMLKPEDFFDADRRTIFEVMLSLRSQGKPAGTLLLADELERLGKFDEVGGVAALNELLGKANNAAHVEYHCRLVRDAAILRRVVQFGIDVANQANVKTRLDELRPMLVTAGELVIDIDETLNCSADGKVSSMGSGGFVRFPVEALPWPLNNFVSEAAESFPCDPCFIALPMLSMLAGAVGNTRRIRVKRDWSEPCLLWTVIAADSGTGKSPAMELPLRPIRDAQHAALVEHRQADEQVRRDRMEFEAGLSEWRKAGRKRGELPPVEPVEPSPTRYIVDDVTVERLAEMLEQQPRGLLLAVDELAGWFGNFDAYRSGRGADVERWLSIHRAGSLIVDRKTGKKLIHVPRASVSVTGTIQPKILASVLANREFLDNGLAARLLLAMPPRTAKQWTEAEVSEEMQAAMDHIVGRLLSLPFGTDQRGEREPITLPLTPTAKAKFVRFFNAHNREQALLGADLSAAWSKLEAYVPRIALLMHLVRWAVDDDKLESANAVDDASLESAIALVGWFANEARRVYAMLGSGDDGEESRRRRLAIEKVHELGGRITVRKLMRCCAEFSKSADVTEQTLNALVVAGLGRWEQSPPGKSGRPSAVFVLGEFAADGATSSDKTSPATDTTSTNPASGKVSSVSMSDDAAA